jgi:hypothetical protein
MIRSDTSKVEAKALGRAIHSLQVHNELYRHEDEGLRDSLNTKQKYKGKSKPLNLQQRKEFHSTAVFWSPSTIREARVRERVQRREDEAAQLQKKSVYQKRIAEEARAARLRDREAKKKEREAMAAELAAARAKKKQERNAATLQKSHDTANRAKRAASQSAVKNPTKRRRATAAAAEPPPPSPPIRTTTRGRKINLPGKYK